jgi:hypothetical protein
MFVRIFIASLLVTSLASSYELDGTEDTEVGDGEESYDQLQSETTVTGDDQQYEEYDYSVKSAKSSHDDNDDGYNQESSYEPEPKQYPEPTHYQPMPYVMHYQSHKPRKKKVYVPVFIPDKEKKKMKIISVEKGFYIPGGTQLFGKFKSLKHCMKACAITPTCFSGDYNPWLHKCYQHTNFTACNTQRAHPQFVHFSKVPCSVVDAPAGHVTLGASMANGIEEKGIDSLQQCIKKCSLAGLGIPATATTQASFNIQACFAIDYDFATHKCFFFGVNVMDTTYLLHCPIGLNAALASSQGTRPNPTVIHITFCPVPTG